MKKAAAARTAKANTYQQPVTAVAVAMSAGMDTSRAQAPPGLSVRISALKKSGKGGPSFPLLIDDIAKQRHKRNPYSEKYLQLCLSSFVQVGCLKPAMHRTPAVQCQCLMTAASERLQ